MPMRVGTPMPSLEGAVEWLNGGPPDLSGGPRAVVVHFWALSCPACKANMGDVQKLRDASAAEGVRFVAVHTPRGPMDRDLAEVRRVVAEIGITEPCAMDDLGIIGSRFDLSAMWPYYFLFDADGRMKRRGAGGIGLRLLTSALDDLRSAALMNA